MPEFISTSPEQTESIAAEWGAKLTPGTVVLLSGDLGAGKTCFVRGLVQGREGDSSHVSSPSFSLVNEYATPEEIIYHWDLYRLAKDTDWAVLDLDDHLNDPQALTVIEWPERRPDLEGIQVTLSEIPEGRKVLLPEPE